MPSSFYEVSLKDTGEDLLEYGLESLAFDKSMEKDNILTLQFRNATNEFIDKDWLRKGTEIVFLYGLKEGYPEDNVTSGKRIAKISDIKRNYQGTINTVTVIATDMGSYMKKVRSKKVWNGSTSAIVNEIASMFGVTAKVSDTSLTHKNLPQSNRTFYDFLKYIASIEKNGDVEFYVNDIEIYFGKRKVDDKSKVTYSRQDPNGKFISLTINEKESSQFGSADNIKVSTINNAKGESTEKSLDKSNIDNNVKTQKYDVNLDQYGKVKYTTPKDKTNSSGAVINSPSDKPDVTNNFANNTIKKAQLEGITATLSISLEPKLNINEVITLEGFPLKDIGNYLITGIKDTVTASGYAATSVELKRAAIGKAKQAEKTSATVNSEAGGGKLDGKKKSSFVFLDQNGKEKG